MVAFQENPKPTQVPKDLVDTFDCGLNKCRFRLAEVCVGGSMCSCKPSEGRVSANDKCQPIDKIPLSLRVTTRNEKPLFYSSEYGDSGKQAYVEFSNLFKQDLGRAVGGTVYAPRYVNTDVSYINHPKTVNSSWPDGLLVNFTVGVTPSTPPVDRCDLWGRLMESLQRSNGAIGGGSMNVASDVDLLDPCAKPVLPGDLCGGSICNNEIGEICIANSVCGCREGEKRALSKDLCRPVESWNIPLWVIRKNQHNLVFNETFANPQDGLNKQYVKSFEGGVAECYPQTTLKNAFVSAEVNDILDPMNVNASWDTGILYNSTMHFRKGAVQIPSDAYTTLLRYIVERNNYQVGHSGLYLNPYQPNPFTACYRNNCHPKGVCIDLGPNAYRCECSAAYRDLNPTDPGRKCVPTKNHNECESKDENQCSENARCIDLDYLYKCECSPGFTDASPKDSIPGSLCVLDYCSDVNFCSLNSTCVNTETQAECQCKKGFVDIRASEKRLSLGMNPDAYCLNKQDVNECALGLTNCSAVASCTDLKIGYTCACPSGYIDGNPSIPGRVCQGLLCDLCHQHGDCIHNTLTNNITCACAEGYTGDFCEVAPSNAPLLLLIFLALLFLLLTLCCLLYLCTKCHCFKRYRQQNAFPWSTLDQSASSDSGVSDLYNKEIGIPRAHLREDNAAQLARYLDEGLRIPRAHLHDNSSMDSGSSEYTIREEIERRVTTDVTKTELRTVTTEADVHNEVNESSSSAVHTDFYPSTAATAGSQHVSMRNGAHMEEQERGESVAEFANSREWQHTQSQSQSSGAKHAHAHASTTVAHHPEEHQDDRSIGAYSVEDDGVYEKSVLMKRNHQLDPANGVEKFSSEVITKKSQSETFHK